MFEPLHTKSKLFIAIGAVIVAVLFYGALWFASSLASGRLAQANDAIAKKRSDTTDIEEIRKAMNEFASAVRIVEDAVLTNSKTVAFIESIEQMARDVGVEGGIETVSSATYPGTSATNYEALRVVISVSGSWNSVYRFLSLLEQLPYRSEVIQATMEKWEEKEPRAETKKNKVWVGDFTLQVLRSKKL